LWFGCDCGPGVAALALALAFPLLLSLSLVPLLVLLLLLLLLLLMMLLLLVLLVLIYDVITVVNGFNNVFISIINTLILFIMAVTSFASSSDPSSSSMCYRNYQLSCLFCKRDVCICSLLPVVSEQNCIKMSRYHVHIRLPGSSISLLR
jgi:hypothetical protein